MMIWARYYDPYSMKFLSEDPIGFRAGDTNFYRYVFNSPLVYNDPSGKIVPLLGIVAVGAFLLIPTDLEDDDSRYPWEQNKEDTRKANELYMDWLKKNDRKKRLKGCEET